MRLPVSIPITILCLFGAGLAPSRGSAEPCPKADSLYLGMCEASGAVAVGADHFLVANDEDNVLRLYQADNPGAALETFEIGAKLGLEEAEKGIDIEGAAELDGTVYWITSHGRTRKGKIKTDRFRFFGSTVKQADGKVSFEVIGSSKQLMQDLLAQLPALGLDPLTKKEEEELAPEELGTNIEGLAAGRNGQLLIGFRNPVPDGKALLVPLENPRQVLAGEKARFGASIALDLGGLGIRSIERLPSGAYLIVAGPSSCGADFRLFRWSGEPDQPKPDDMGTNLSGLGPEVIAVFPARNAVLLLSDDGDVRVQGKRCQDIPGAQQTFRGRWISMPGL